MTIKERAIAVFIVIFVFMLVGIASVLAFGLVGMLTSIAFVYLLIGFVYFTLGQGFGTFIRCVLMWFPAIATGRGSLMGGDDFE